MNNLAVNKRSTQILPFGGDLPAYMAGLPDSTDMSEYTQGVGSSFAVMSIKGKTFTLVQEGVRTIVTRPDDPDSPASYIEVVLVKANPNFSKVFYTNGYVEGSNSPPDCSSFDGQKPDAGVPSPQSKTCANCPNNVFGTSATGKGKACQDTRRVAILSLGQMDNPMLLRVPPNSLRNLATYANELAGYRIKTMAAVVTRVKFDPNESTPKLLFEPRGILAENTFNLVSEIAQSDTVRQIVGLAPVEGAPTLNLPKVSHEQVEEVVNTKQETPPAAPKPKAAPAKKAEKVQANSMDALNAALDDMFNEFDG